MASFVNTRTSLGEQAAFDAIIEDALTELIEDGVTIIEANSIAYLNNLKSVNFPNVTRIFARGFYEDKSLESIDIGKPCYINSGSLGNLFKLKALILRGTESISQLSTRTTLSDTMIGLRLAGILVPRSMIPNYLADTKWASYSNVIRAIEDMPITDFSTITHTWTQIKDMVDDESFFSSNYAEGDFKTFTYGDHTVNAEIAKINSTSKYVDFVLKNTDEIINQMSYSSGMIAYSQSELKTRLDDIYANELPSDLKAAITPVSKEYYVYDGTTETVTAPLWALNSKDVNATGEYLKESEGEEYSIFATNAERIKYYQKTFNGATWALGTSPGSNKFVMITTSGGFSAVSHNSSSSLIFGFRIQKSA